MGRAGPRPMIDANMDWPPKNVFTDQRVLAAFVESIPREDGVFAPVPGKADVQQIVIEQPKGDIVLNYPETQYNAAV
jgi:hypothetical protein